MKIYKNVYNATIAKQKYVENLINILEDTRNVLL